MINEKNMKNIQEDPEGDSLEFREQITDQVQRGTIVGIEGRPGITEAGEYSVIANDVSILA